MISGDSTEYFWTLSTMLHDSKINYLRTKILLSSLEEIANNGDVTDSIASKLKSVLLFGDLKEYLDSAQYEHDIPRAERMLLGISIDAVCDRNVKLTNVEKLVVFEALRKNIEQKNQLIYEMFIRYRPNGFPETLEESLEKLVGRLKKPVTRSVVWDQHKEICTDIKKCYEELGKCQVMLSALVDMKLDGGEPLHSSISKLNELHLNAIETKSRGLLGDVKNEFFSDNGAEALGIIHSKQKEEIVIKKLELARLREELSQYEKMKSEGFDDILKEYLHVTEQRKEKEKLKEDYVEGL